MLDKFSLEIFLLEIFLLVSKLLFNEFSFSKISVSFILPLSNFFSISFKLLLLVFISLEDYPYKLLEFIVGTT